jgi:hypothetical protein
VDTVVVANSDDATVRLRGSQKSNSVSEMEDRGSGDGDGERDGQAVADRRSEDEEVERCEFIAEGFRNTKHVAPDVSTWSSELSHEQ